MKRKTSKRQNAPVSNETIANSLPINKQFTAKQFAHYTGISERSAHVRVNKLTKEGSMTRCTDGKGGKNVVAMYMMTIENKRDMLLDYKNTIEKKRKKGARLDSQPSRKRLGELFDEAKQSYCDYLLKRAGLA